METKKNPDILQTITQGVRGGKKTNKVTGWTKIVVCKGFNAPENSIEIDGYKGLGKNYEPRETAILFIDFEDRTQWTGTFKELKEQLFK